jgi:hypothetical protein
MSVVLINPFEVPEGKESEALALWDRAQKLINGKIGLLCQLQSQPFPSAT